MMPTINATGVAIGCMNATVLLAISALKFEGKSPVHIKIR